MMGRVKSVCEKVWMKGHADKTDKLNLIFFFYNVFCTLTPVLQFYSKLFHF